MEPVKLVAIVLILHVDVLNRQKVRKTVLRKACSEFNIHPSRDRKLTKKALASLQHTLVINKYRLLYCYVPKVGCTSWKQLFLVAYGIVDIKERQKSMHKESNSAFKTPGQLEQTEANQKLQDYNNFLKQKTTTGPFNTSYVTHVWSSTTSIGKYETVQEDAETFLRSATNDSLLKYPDTDPAKPITNNSSDENMVKYYRTIPNDVFKSLISFFYRDLRLFGYSIPDAIKRPHLRLSKLQLKLKELE
eukprot:XP_011680803.1 PREDICTED: uncharacterized protein LOC105446104 [Strongylocentrotus purpuratus]